VFVTWRLAGTLPQPPPAFLVADSDVGRRFLLNDRQLDRTHDGPRWLGNPTIADSFVEALLYGERVRRSYDLYAWVVMPNHVHVVLKPHQKLPEVVRWVKTATAVRANSIAGRKGLDSWRSPRTGRGRARRNPPAARPPALPEREKTVDGREKTAVGGIEKTVVDGGEKALGRRRPDEFQAWLSSGPGS
jgi:hypothetical protein